MIMKLHHVNTSDWEKASTQQKLVGDNSFTHQDVSQLYYLKILRTFLYFKEWKQIKTQRTHTKTWNKQQLHAD